MFKSVSRKIVNDAAKIGILQDTEIEEYAYGINYLFITLINIFSAIIIGVLFHVLLEMIVFLIVFKFLRKYIGGAHSRTPTICYITSCLTYIAASISIKYYPLSPMLTVISVIISLAILYLVCPVEAEKKPLDDIEYRVFKRRGRITIFVTLLIFLILFCFSDSTIGHFTNVIAVGVFTVTLFTLEGVYNNSKKATFKR